jgi:hypothetical protein
MVAEGGYKNMRHMSGREVKEVNSGITLTQYVTTLLNTDCKSLMYSSS